MTATWFLIVCQLSVVACAVVAGVFLTFSDFVMRSLGGAKTEAGVEVMQVINREVYRSVFMVLLLGMAVLSPLLAGYAMLRVDGPAGALIMAGGVLYLAGVLGVTVIFNVPMNKRLDAQDHTGPDAAAYWSRTYRPRWTIWNHVRTAAAAGSAILFLMACIALAQGIGAAG